MKDKIYQLGANIFMAEQVKRATVQETVESLKSNANAILIDIREEHEVQTLAPDMGIWFPMSKINLDTFEQDCSVKKNQPIFLFCRSGNRSMNVAIALSQVGYSNLTNVEGGIIAWQSAGLPTK